MKLVSGGPYAGFAWRAFDFPSIQSRKTLVANKIVLKSKELTSIALTCLALRNFHEVSRAGGPT
jgi:hypothetical protein